MIIAVDFDGTIQIDGQPNLVLIRDLMRARRSGATLILWTCRAGDRLAQAVDFCRQNGLQVDLVNENTPQTIRQLGYNPRKILADIYIDDKAWRRS